MIFYDKRTFWQHDGVRSNAVREFYRSREKKLVKERCFLVLCFNKSLSPKQIAKHFRRLGYRFANPKELVEFGLISRNLGGSLLVVSLVETKFKSNRTLCQKRA